MHRKPDCSNPGRALSPTGATNWTAGLTGILLHCLHPATREVNAHSLLGTNKLYTILKRFYSFMFPA